MKTIFFLWLLSAIFVLPAGYAAEKAEKDPRIEVKVTPPEDVKYKKGKKIPVLIITANYRSSVILAEIARREKQVPYILLPAIGEEKGKIHFIPARKEDIFPVPARELGRFIAFLAPEKIIVLGDELMVPRSFRPLSTPETVCLNIASPNWNYNSLTLGNFLMLRQMPSLYEKACRDKITDPLTKGLEKVREKEEKTAAKK